MDKHIFKSFNPLNPIAQPANRALFACIGGSWHGTQTADLSGGIITVTVENTLWYDQQNPTGTGECLFGGVGNRPEVDEHTRLSGRISCHNLALSPNNRVVSVSLLTTTDPVSDRGHEFLRGWV